MRGLGSAIWKLIEEIIKATLIIITRTLKREFNKESCDAVIQFVKFGIVGVSNNVAFYFCYVVWLLAFRRFGIFEVNGYLVAQAIAFLISMLWSFYWNYKVVFLCQEGDKRSVIKSFIKMFLSYAFTGLLLNSILSILWVRILHLSEFISPIINLFISVPINFVINKLWAFK